MNLAKLLMFGLIALTTACSDDDEEPAKSASKFYYPSYENLGGNRTIAIHAFDLIGSSGDRVLYQESVPSAQNIMPFTGLVTSPKSNFLIIARSYYAGESAIYRMKKEETTQLELLYDKSDGLLDVGYELVIDDETSTLYWLQNRDRELMKANVDGSGRPVKLSVFNTLTGGYIAGLAMDKKRGVFYTIDGDQGIYQVNLDGSNGKHLYKYTNADRAPYSSLAYDASTDRLYILNIEGAISYVNPGNPTAITRLYNNLEEVYALSVDPVGKKLYWAGDEDTFGFFSANQDGSGDIKRHAPNFSSQEMIIE